MNETNSSMTEDAAKRPYEAPALVEHDLLLDVTAQTASGGPTTPPPTTFGF